MFDNLRRENAAKQKLEVRIEDGRKVPLKPS